MEMFTRSTRCREERGVVGAVRSKITPDNQPPSAMPNTVAIITVPTRHAGFLRREELADDDGVGGHDPA